MEQIYIGLISGTSLDGIDAIAIDLSEPTPRVLATFYQPYDDGLRQQLRQVCLGCNDELQLYADLDNQLGRDFAIAAITVSDKAGLKPEQIRAIGSHGQTVRHYPHTSHPNSLQIGDPNVIAELTGITTVADLRRRDMAVGGEGAPMVPAFHNALFRSSACDRIIINIGGIANLTLLPADDGIPVSGWDSGPGNTLMNAWIFTHQQQPQDTDGRWAAQGNTNPALLNDLLQDDYFHRQPPKSTGPEYFNLAWLDRYLDQYPDSAVNVQATLCELTTRTITLAIEQALKSQAISTKNPEIFICGGGCHNPQIMQQLRKQLDGLRLETTQALGLDPDWVEAAAFAWLAQQTMDGMSGNLPAVTGARHPVILGGIYQAGSRQ